jgi:hypothetical protein
VQHPVLVAKFRCRKFVAIMEANLTIVGTLSPLFETPVHGMLTGDRKPRF